MSEDQQTVTVADRLQAAWESCPSGDGRGLPPIIFSEAEAAHILAALADRSAADKPEPFLAQLRRVNLARYEAWVEGADAGIMFDALELGGEVGELLNVVKKLEREERGWRGSRANPADFVDECADVMICLDKLARRRNVDLAAATIDKFNATSEKVGLPHRLVGSSADPVAWEPEVGSVATLARAKAGGTHPEAVPEEAEHPEKLRTALNRIADLGSCAGGKKPAHQLFQDAIDIATGAL